MPTPFDDVIAYGRLLWNGVSGVWKLVRGLKRRLTPQQRLELRAKWKPQFEKFDFDQQRKKLRRDVIVRDIKRLDIYPQISKGRGISSWFRGSLIDTYEKGIMVGLGFESLVPDGEDRWAISAVAEGTSEVTLMRTGFIPYDNIESVDWDGDSYYSYPHIYCYFDIKGMPYERIMYCDHFELDGFEHWRGKIEYKKVRHHKRKWFWVR